MRPTTRAAPRRWRKTRLLELGREFGVRVPTDPPARRRPTLYCWGRGALRRPSATPGCRSSGRPAAPTGSMTQAGARRPYAAPPRGPRGGRPPHPARPAASHAPRPNARNRPAMWYRARHRAVAGRGGGPRPCSPAPSDRADPSLRLGASRLPRRRRSRAPTRRALGPRARCAHRRARDARPRRSVTARSAAHFGAYLHALKWSAVSAADATPSRRRSARASSSWRTSSRRS